MDQRLLKIDGQRLARLTRAETPAVAKVLVAYCRKQAQVKTGVLNEVAYVQLVSSGSANVIIRWDDWVKIRPYLVDGSFDTTIIPEPTLFNAHPEVLSDESTLDIRDGLYRRILTVLNRLFTVEFPKSV